MMDNKDIITIADTFTERFAHWKITLPEEYLKNRCNGFINKAGWLIQFCFGKDEKGEYLDYYASHRMTDDSHVRIYADGHKKNLPALCSWYKLSDDPVEAKRLKDEHDQHNREVVEMLAEKGFDKFTINMYLSAGMNEQKKSYLPDEFEIKIIFFGMGGCNRLYIKKDRLVFNYFPERYSKDKPRNLEITPLKNEWVRFWSKIDEIGAWEWKDKYEPPPGICADGDISDIFISYKGKEIMTHCWCNAPSGLK